MYILFHPSPSLLQARYNRQCGSTDGCDLGRPGNALYLDKDVFGEPADLNARPRRFVVTECSLVQCIDSDEVVHIFDKDLYDNIRPFQDDSDVCTNSTLDDFPQLRSTSLDDLSQVLQNLFSLLLDSSFDNLHGSWVKRDAS